MHTNYTNEKISTLTGALIIVATAVVLFGGVFGWQYYLIQNSNLKPQNENVKSESGEWKTYTSENGYFSIQYPSQWRLFSSPSEANPDNDNNKVISFYKDSIGEISISWPTGFGGWCSSETYTNVVVGKDIISTCHYISEGKEEWTSIYKTISPTVEIGVIAVAYAPLETNRATILKMLQSMQFNINKK